MDEKLHSAVAMMDGLAITATFNVPHAEQMALVYSTARMATVCVLRDSLVRLANFLACHVSMGHVDRQVLVYVTQGTLVSTAI
jgi:hypothetical protein